MNQRVYVAIQCALILMNALFAVKNWNENKSIVGQILVITLLIVFVVLGTDWRRFWHG